MTLYDVLRAMPDRQYFYVYVANVYDQNICVGAGTRTKLLDAEQNEELFDHLCDKVDMMTVCAEREILVRLIDDTFKQRAEELYDARYVAKWDNLDPKTRPWKHSCELEDFGV